MANLLENENLILPGQMIAKVISFDKGLEVFEEVRQVRIESKGYTLLIMEDYMPVIGEVDGKVIISGDEETREYAGVKGFYKHSHNSFSLLLSEEGGENDA